MPEPTPPPEASAFLNALQLADSALPIGRFVHSYGLETWLARNPHASEHHIAELVATTVSQSAGPLDGAAVAHAHTTTTVAELTTLDRRLTAHKISEPAREASQACGRRLAPLAAQLSPDPLLESYAKLVQTRETDGNLPIVEGCLARALGLTTHQAILLELRGTSTALLSAAIRLGRLSPVTAQTILHGLTPTLERAAAQAHALPLDDLHTSTPEMEICALLHRHTDIRVFST